ncbi:titin, putative [Ixodes scapularis]|uniref:Titin, putative n=1 Tax=Ixodes scapularis TaxID=6945 RepID=B7PGA5_IXOSC|nr:titin, putative [Ixodes scapularis]|eukprot:XP_002434227.1 titin, putative [Ixodes scapularis]
MSTGGHSSEVMASVATTTTISSIAVQSGNTRLVIALLQYNYHGVRISDCSERKKSRKVEKPKGEPKEKPNFQDRLLLLLLLLTLSGDALELKIQELSPEMSDVGSTYEEALHLQQQHQQVLQKLQNKQSPVEELLSQADELIANQKPKAQPTVAIAAVAALETQHENLQDTRRRLGHVCEARKEALEKRLRSLLLSQELDEVQHQLERSTEETALGDSPASSEILLHEHTTRVAPTNEKMRDRMLKLLKAAKQIQDAELETRAYDLMAQVTSRIERDDARKKDLKDSVEFFNEAQTALNKLDQLQIQVSQGAVQDVTAATTLLDACVEKPLRLGRDLLMRVSSGTNGIQEKVHELENRRLHVKQLYTQKTADAVHSSERAVNFLSQCNSLYTWCIEVVQTFLEQNNTLGVGLQACHGFLQKHQGMLNELQAKEPQMTSLLVQDDAKAKELLQLWQHCRTLLEQRIRLAQRYQTCCKLSSQLLEGLKTIHDASHERQIVINENFMQFDHNASNFLLDAHKIQDSSLDISRAIRHVQETLDQCRQLKNKPGNNTEQLVREAQRTMESAVKIESELYPAIPRELTRAETIAQYLDRHLDTLMPLVRSELDARIETSHSLQRKEQLVEELRSTQQSFQENISKYQDLVKAMINFFNYFSQLEKQLQDRQDDEALLDEAKRQADHLAALVDRTEPSEAAVLDRDKIHFLVDNRRQMLAASLRKSQQDSQMSKFNEELQQINHQVRELTDSLKRDSSKCHMTLEKRIEILSTSSRTQTDSARMELEQLTSRWRAFHKEAMAPPPQPLDRKEANQICGPSFVVPLDDVEVQDGSKCSLVCVLAGQPAPTVQWYKDGVSVRGNSDYVTASQPLEDGSSEQKLTIEETLADDSAKFTCKAINAAGMAETSCRLSVREQPRQQELEEVFIEALEQSVETGTFQEPTFVKPLPATARFRPGDQLRLECRVEGQPEPRVSWSKDLLPVRDAAKSSLERGTAVLVLNDAVQSDSGTYTAVAQNKAGQTACSSQVKVAEDVPPAEPPRVLKGLVDLEVKPGPEPVTLECIIVGEPEPEVIWYHDDQPIKESERVRLLFQGDKCSLVLNGVSAQNAGTYRCSAVNTMGSCFTQCRLRVPLAAPVFLEPLRDVNVAEGARVDLSAKLWAPEPPFVRWFKDGNEVVPGSDYQIKHDTDGAVRLTIPEAFNEDGGHYELEASNAGGRTRTGCRVHVERVEERFRISREKWRHYATHHERTTIVLTSRKMRSMVLAAGVVVVCVVSKQGTLTISEAFPEDSGDLQVRVQGPGGTVTANTRLVVLDEDDDGSGAEAREEALHRAREVKVYETKLARSEPDNSAGVALSGDLQLRVTEVTQVNEMPPEVSEEITTKVVDQQGARDKVTEEVTRRVTKRVTEITKTQTKEVRGPLVYKWEFRK